DSDHQSTDPGAIIGSNDDLLTQILLRLPAASILRFKSLQLDQLVVAFPEMISPYGNYFFVIDVMRSEEDEENTFVINWMRYYRSFFAALSCEAACFIQIMTDEYVASGM
ncbi:hypothetical protein M8C21_024008, partial [Ambrosia artemisiifolia]